MERPDPGPETVPAPQGAGPTTALAIPSWVLDLVVCAGMAGLGLWFALGARALPTSRAAIDPGTFPAIIGWLLVALCVMQAAASYAGRRDTAPAVTARPAMVGLGMAMVLLFPSAMEAFGYYVTAAIWVPAFAWIAGMRSWLGFVLITAIILGLARLVFEAILGTPLS
jgi:hypothetical protein